MPEQVRVSYKQHPPTGPFDAIVIGSGIGVIGRASPASDGALYYIGAGGYSTDANNGENIGVYGIASNGATNYAGVFDGNVDVNGTLSKNAGSFKIDHPLDPANKYLSHSFVESPDMKNIYDGVVVMDASGEARVELPDWFDSLNKDFRYQLTCIGGFAPVYVAQEIDSNQFRIAGGTAGLKVSWQVTGVRQDAYAKANPMQVEVDKQDSERGQYLHPAVFGLPETRNVQFEKLKAAREARGD